MTTDITKNSKTSSPKITVAIAAFNSANYLSEAIESIQSQSLKDFECIVVDDGSTDRTHLVVKQISNKDNRFRLIKHPLNMGLPTARNTALNAAKGQYIIFLDSDDIFDLKMLEKTYDRAEVTKADIVAFNFSEYKMSKKKTIKKIINEELVPNSLVFKYKDITVSNNEIRLEAISNMTSNKLYRVSYLIKNNLKFNEKLLRSQDLEFGLRAYMLAKKITFIKEPLMTYRTEIATSNQSTLSKHPTMIFDSLLSIKKFFISKSIFIENKKDFYDLAIHHVTGAILKNSVSAKKEMLRHAPLFFKKLGITKSYTSQLSENKQSLLIAMIDGDIDKYLDAEKNYLINSLQDLSSRIETLEDRIELELKELAHYRDKPSLKTASIILSRAVSIRCSQVFHKFIKQKY